MSLILGARLARFGPVRLGAYKRLNRNDVEDIGLIALAALLVVIAFDVLRVAAWIVYEILRLSWRGLRWLWRRERAEKAASSTAAALIALALAVAVLCPARASADPDDSPGVASPDHSYTGCLPGGMACVTSPWQPGSGSAECVWWSGRWWSPNAPDGKCRAVGAHSSAWPR